MHFPQESSQDTKHNKKKAELHKQSGLKSYYTKGKDLSAVFHRVKLVYLFFNFSIYASMTAMAVMLTTSLTELSKSVKWMALFNPI